MKLEDIDRNNIFKVPQDYFDELPARTQSKIRQRERSFLPNINWQLVVKVSVSITTILLLVFYLNPFETKNELSNPGDILSQVSTDDVIAYLELEDIGTSNIIDQIDLSDADFLQYDEDSFLDELNLDESQLIEFIDAF